MLEILILLFLSASIHFLTLVFHNKQSFNSKTFFKASTRILCFSIFLIFTLFAVKPFLKNIFDELLIVLIVGFFVFWLFYIKDYKNDS